jgi:hypothetical protein
MSNTRHRADDLVSAVMHLRETTQSQAEHEQCRRWLEER